ncbi:MAG: type II toxin-antitoxin system prevent-host-death family antitoxin [bacterium]|nr:type II toxin-antitoxin system prevent-host-death family antitoxin [bacterium]
MGEIKTVGIKELKNNLSAYLREVRLGTRVFVSDRNRVVAELHEPRAGYAVDDPMHPRLVAWIESGVVSPPIVGKTKLPTSPVKLDEGTAERLLDEDRRDRTG